MSKILTTTEAAKMLNVHPETLRRYAEKGDIDSERTPGGHRRFREADVLSFKGGEYVPGTLKEKPTNKEVHLWQVIPAVLLLLMVVSLILGGIVYFLNDFEDNQIGKFLIAFGGFLVFITMGAGAILGGSYVLYHVFSDLIDTIRKYFKQKSN